MKPRALIASFILFTLIAGMNIASHAQETNAEPVTHVIQPGETLQRIALRYGVTMDALARQNNITNYNRIYYGQTLVIPGLTVPTSSASVENPLIAVEPVVYVVQSGDTLRSIAERYGTTIEQIMQANNIANPNYIRRGDRLNIWTPATTAAVIERDATVDQTPAPAAQPQLVHTVQRGEILSRIAQRYGVPMSEIMRANNIVNPDRVLVGQRLTIPGVSAPPRPTPPANIVAPTPEITRGKFILVDLSDSMTYAYQDGVLVYSALSSMGLPATPTVVGRFSIYRRVREQTMSGPGYSLPGVQYVQYFYQGYALHGAYWHNNFGQPMSRGCVNMTNEDARWFYNFAEIGTPVHVQY